MVRCEGGLPEGQALPWLHWLVSGVTIGTFSRVFLGGPSRMALPPHQADWAVRALRDMIYADGRGTKRFAREVLVRPPSTIYRWLSGSRPIPKCVREYMLGEWRILAPPPVAKTTTAGGPNEQQGSAI